MAHLQSYTYPGWGEWAAKNEHYSQAIRVGDRIMTSGQGGWEPRQKDYEVDSLITKDLEGEIAQAFENVDINLKDAGGKGWSQVYRVITYSTDIPSQHDFINNNFRKWMPNHKPLWTMIGVRQLGVETMHFEIEVEAHDPKA